MRYSVRSISGPPKSDNVAADQVADKNDHAQPLPIGPTMPPKAPYQHRNPIVRYALFSIGWISFVLGMIGLLLPVVPTSPFLLLSAACFLRSSPRFYVWLTEHPWWGRYICYFLDGQGIPRRIKVLILCMLWIMILSSAFLIVKIMWVSVTMMVIAAAVSIYIVRLPEPRE
ncbi:MAG: uncharacterized membrane protein YbaN (DUF454 family) [Zhongshania aliphaticivorans]|jgi:uncharacterized membrane protein YbaN (DUF454 family)|tara:strand:+ start:740 stop:1252 length:513 start_codon:yes stop_codon:yes gene_type:complete